MHKLIILGSSCAVPDTEHSNTHLLIRANKQHHILVDCACDVVQRLQKTNTSLDTITDIILTHVHPDHISGTPMLLMSMWLLGRKKSINIYGTHHTIDGLKKILDVFGWQDWPNFFPINYLYIEEQENFEVLKTNDLLITSSPVQHFISTIGIRVMFSNGKSFAYSCDTEPCTQTIELGKTVDVLLHEATGELPGHSSAQQAGMIANQANAKKLYLIHYCERGVNSINLLSKAKEHFSGPIHLATDLMEIDFS